MENLNLDRAEEFGNRLLNWHRRERRDFPWRNTRNPFHIVIAEIMLQKTDVKKVARVYDDFVRRYPSPESLARADVDEVKSDLKTLGIHRRAHRLRVLAADILEKFDGRIPDEKEKLLEMLGVGEYTANAVLSLAYGCDLPLLDTNAIRILKRVFSIRSRKSRPRTDKGLWAVAEQIIPRGRGRDFNLAMLDFAALVCTARNPDCGMCVIADMCDYHSASMKEGQAHSRDSIKG